MPPAQNHARAGQSMGADPTVEEIDEQLKALAERIDIGDFGDTRDTLGERDILVTIHRRRPAY